MLRHPDQTSMFGEERELPKGLAYRADFITLEEERDLIGYLEHLPLEEARSAEGYVGKRRVMNFGWEYDFVKKRVEKGPALPSFLVPLARRIAKWVHIPKAHVVEALINEYPAGTGVGWHRDNEPFTHIVGVSLGAPCKIRFRPLASRQAGLGKGAIARATLRTERRNPKDVTTLSLAPGSAYLMQHEVRWEYQHSVAPVSARRWSITFRTLPLMKASREEGTETRGMRR